MRMRMRIFCSCCPGCWHQHPVGNEGALCHFNFKGFLRLHWHPAPPEDAMGIFLSYFKTLVGKTVVVELKNDVKIQG